MAELTKRRLNLPLMRAFPCFTLTDKDLPNEGVRQLSLPNIVPADKLCLQMNQLRRRQMAEILRRERSIQPSRSSEEAYAQMARMKACQKERLQDTSGGFSTVGLHSAGSSFPTR